MALPQYMFDLHDIEHFRERSEMAMRDLMMLEEQPIAFRASWSLEATYCSYAYADGGVGGTVPQSSSEAPSFQDVYAERKLLPPSDPASVIINSYTFPAGIASPLLPPHPMDLADSYSSPVVRQAKQLPFIGVHLYVPLTCEGNPLWNTAAAHTSLCQKNHWELLSTFKKARALYDVSFLNIDLEGLRLSEDGSSPEAFEQTRARPVLFYLHGGGLVSLSTAAYDKLLRRMANLLGPANAVLISIDYRLAPEHKFPIPMEDCLHGIDFVVQNAQDFGMDANNLAILGDSAGGALVASVLAEAFRLSEKHPWVKNVKHAALVYPSVCRGCPTRSHLLYGNKHTLSNDIWFGLAHTNILGPITDWRQMPLSIPPYILSQFPPTSLVLFTHDIQYEAGILFHERLRRAGVHTSIFIAPGMHGFFGSDAWSEFGVKSVEWTAERIFSSIQPDDKRAT